MRILICEDEEIMLTALEFRLRRQGYEVLRAEDGQKALDILSSEQIDIVVADVMMPYISGLQLITHIKENLVDKIPVIVISAIEEDEVVLEAFRLGAVDFISKPFRPKELILRIRRIAEEMNRL